MNTPQTPDYGEPWKLTPIDQHDALFLQLALIRTRYGVEVCDHYRKGTIRECDERGERIVACVNACAGMADPAKEIEAMREAIKEGYRILEFFRWVIPDLVNLTEKQYFSTQEGKSLDAALAKLQPFIKP